MAAGGANLWILSFRGHVLALGEGAGRLLGHYRASGAETGGHITMPTTVGISRSKHSAERAMHVKHVLFAGLLRAG
jgi:hypothetical protein